MLTSRLESREVIEEGTGGGSRVIMRAGGGGGGPRGGPLTLTDDVSVGGGGGGFDIGLAGLFALSTPFVEDGGEPLVGFGVERGIGIDCTRVTGLAGPSEFAAAFVPFADTGDCGVCGVCLLPSLPSRSFANATSGEPPFA